MRDRLMHLFQEALRGLHSVADCRDEPNENYVEEHVAFHRGARCETLHAHFLEALTLRFFDLLHLRDYLHSFIR